MPDISANLLLIKKNISLCAHENGRNPEDVILVCVTKMISIERIQEALRCGVRDIGESRVEEALQKKARLPQGIRWHMVGHLQTRKAKDAVRIFDLIHSIDSIRLAEEIDKRSRETGKVQDILIEVNISGEESKYGFMPEEVINSIKEIAHMPNVAVKGLMTMAPIANNPESTRPVFMGLRGLKDKIVFENIPNIEMKYLSMGMTQDYMVAIGEGANMVRIGTAIFGG